MAEEKKETKKTEEQKAAEKKTAVKKTSEKKTAEKKTAAKKTNEKKTAEKKTAAEKTAEKKAPAKKTSEKKPATKKTETKKTEAKKESAVAKETVKKAETVKEGIKEEAKEETPLHPTLQKKKEAREAKAARKAANMVEEKKSRPNNALLAILIFGILIGMFAFIAGYNYFQKSASIEKYMEDNGVLESFSDFEYDEHTKGVLKAEGNTVKMVLKVDEDAPKETVEQFEGEEGTEKLKEIAAYFLTTYKPMTRGFGGTAKVAAKQGEKTINSVKMSYREAKNFVKEMEKKYEEEAENVDVDAENIELDTEDLEVDDENLDVQIDSEEDLKEDADEEKSE